MSVGQVNYGGTNVDDEIVNPVFTKVDSCELSIKSLQATYIDPRFTREDPTAYNEHFRKLWVTVIGPTQASVCHPSAILKAEKHARSKGMPSAARPNTGSSGLELPVSVYVKRYNRKASKSPNHNSPDGPRIIDADQYMEELRSTKTAESVKGHDGEWWAKEYAFIDV